MALPDEVADGCSDTVAPRSTASSVLAGPGSAGRRRRERFRRAFVRRVNGPGRARGALVAVTCQGEDLTTTSAACARAGTDARLLVCVKARGLVRFGKGRLAFGHPLIHDAVYYGASAGSAGDALRGRRFEVTTYPADLP